MGVKRIIKKGIIQSLKPARYLIGKNPKLKRATRSLILSHIVLPEVGVAHWRERNDYMRWVMHNYPDALEIIETKEQTQDFSYKPLISILMPTYNTKHKYLRESIESVQSQIYENWQLCVVDDASPDSEVRKIIEEFSSSDKRIKHLFRANNGHIAAASNDALAMAEGEFIGLLDHDDLLWPNALFEVVKTLNQDPKVDFFYSDEDKVTNDRRDHQSPFLKPDWNPEFLESVNMVTHFAVMRTKLVNQIGGFNTKYNGAQDWDLFLRLSESTKRIHHIPKVLYSWRMSETSTAAATDAKPYVRSAQQSALQASLKRRGQKASVIRGMEKDYWTVVYPVVGKPKVSIIIPTKNHLKIAKRCIDSIFKMTTYKNFEIIIVDTGSVGKKIWKWYEKVAQSHRNLKVLKWPEQPFSYARSCNFGADNASGEYLLFLNDDTEVMTTNWIELMLGDAQRADIGAVGCKLYYPGGNLIQHAGVGIGLGGYAANLLSQIPKDNLSFMQHLYANTRHEISAVTAACALVSKHKFEQAGKFDESLAVTYNDVDLCLKLNQKGWRNIYNPSIELIHHESLSLGRPGKDKKRDSIEFTEAKALFKHRWQDKIDHDPHLNPNLSRDNALLEIVVEPVK